MGKKEKKKRILLNMRKMKRKIKEIEDGDIKKDKVKKIEKKMNVREEEVV